MKNTILAKHPKIALVADVENWAFHNYAKQIVKNLSDKYSFKIFFHGDYENIEDLMLEVKDFDLIHFFWRGILFHLLSPDVQSSFAKNGKNYVDFLKNTVANANITTSVYDHLYLSENEIQEREVLYEAISIGYTTCSKRLNDIYSSVNYPLPDSVIENGIDLDYFTPKNVERFYKQKEEIIIGWAGNSKWGGDGIDHKGLETIIKPAIAELRAEGYKIRGFYADRHERWIPHSEMNDYYNSIDIYVCASDMEGSPDPVLESMACGLPVISTNVGIISEVFGPIQQNYILAERSVENLKSQLVNLVLNPQKRKSLSIENLKSIKKRSWKNQCLKWDTFFSSILEASNNESFRKRRDVSRSHSLKMFLTSNETKDLNRQLNSDVEQLKVALVNSEERVAKLEIWTQELQTAFQNAESQVLSLDKKTQLLLSNLETLQHNLDEASLQLKLRESEAYELNKELNLVTEKISNAENKIALIEKSKFWKARNYWFSFKDMLLVNKGTEK